MITSFDDVSAKPEFSENGSETNYISMLQQELPRLWRL